MNRQFSVPIHPKQNLKTVKYGLNCAHFDESEFECAAIREVTFPSKFVAAFLAIAARAFFRVLRGERRRCGLSNRRRNGAEYSGVSKHGFAGFSFGFRCAFSFIVFAAKARLGFFPAGIGRGLLFSDERARGFTSSPERR